VQKGKTTHFKLLKDMLPEENTLLNRNYEAKKIICYKKIHACPNDCITTRKIGITYSRNPYVRPKIRM